MNNELVMSSLVIQFINEDIKKTVILDTNTQRRYVWTVFTDVKLTFIC